MEKETKTTLLCSEMSTPKRVDSFTEILVDIMRWHDGITEGIPVSFIKGLKFVEPLLIDGKVFLRQTRKGV
ncbi:hypothetical protein [Chitinophaga barathri]|nr:hypothetical protein [Chitinophaga barathri]